MAVDSTMAVSPAVTTTVAPTTTVTPPVKTDETAGTVAVATTPPETAKKLDVMA